ncbi:MAG: gamma-glutamyl-gamma-aminobutyrate hydrolase family protein [Rhodobacteraceae bacterium]|nr:gamma-glutamyl-gamma-aminobutyrate hydrolase family protein [Paracoccaceae bacterium]
MRRPIVGIIGNNNLLNDEYPVHTGGLMNSMAVAQVAGCMPLIIPSDPRLVSVDELLELCDGFVLTGAAKCAPRGIRRGRDRGARGFRPVPRRGHAAAAGQLAARGQPFFGICRGFPEVNVAMGGTLHPEIRDLPGRMNHRMPPEGTLDEKFALRHVVRFSETGPFRRLLGADEVMTNTLHGQGIKTAGARIVDGWAPDGTPEALFVEGAPGFTLSVQWHPEYNAASDPVSRPLFEAFGDAARAWAASRAGIGAKALSA